MGYAAIPVSGQSGKTDGESLTFRKGFPDML
jgi:hypothetical protein